MKNARELLKGNTPTLVLAVLQDGALHGYAIAREIERRSEKSLIFKEGTLYPALHALEDQGLIRGEWHREPGRRERRVYTLTPEGRRVFEERAVTWRRFTSAIDSVLKGASHDEPRHSVEPGTRLEPDPAG